MKYNIKASIFVFVMFLNIGFSHNLEIFFEKGNELYNKGEYESAIVEYNKILNEKLLEVGDRVFFDYDQSSFKKEGIETLKRQARFLIANQNITVTIEGHCDARGTREYNLALGERRAYSVKSFLTSLGVEDSRISIISFGKEKLQSLENNEKAWAQSRTAITTINP